MVLSILHPDLCYVHLLQRTSEDPFDKNYLDRRVLLSLLSIHVAITGFPCLGWIPLVLRGVLSNENSYRDPSSSCVAKHKGTLLDDR